MNMNEYVNMGTEYGDGSQITSSSLKNIIQNIINHPNIFFGSTH